MEEEKKRTWEVNLPQTKNVIRGTETEPDYKNRKRVRSFFLRSDKEYLKRDREDKWREMLTRKEKKK